MQQRLVRALRLYLFLVSLLRRLGLLFMEVVFLAHLKGSDGFPIPTGRSPPDRVMRTFWGASTFRRSDGTERAPVPDR
jgi:hypothetical protein